MNTIVEQNMPHHHQSHASCNKLLPPGPPVLNIFSSEEDTPALPVLNSFSLEEDTPAVLKDEYEILREIGRGASGVVHEAIHIKVCCVQVLTFVSSKYLMKTHIQFTTTMCVWCGVVWCGVDGEER